MTKQNVHRRFFAALFVMAASILLLSAATGPAYAQGISLDDAPDNLRYEIAVEFDAHTGAFHGRQIIGWRNSTDVAVDWAPLHLHLNAFSNGSSTWLANSRLTAMRFGDDGVERVWGFLEPDRITQYASARALNTGAGAELIWAPFQPDDGNPFDRSLIKVKLAETIEPNEELILEIDFTGQLPAPGIARTGCLPARAFCILAQWYPQLGAVAFADRPDQTKGIWAADQFHVGGEFFASFADFEVSITTQREAEVLGSGLVYDVEEMPGDKKRLRLRQQSVHHFALFVGEASVASFEHRTPSGRDIVIQIAAASERDVQFDKAASNLKRVIDILDRRIGAYPYEHLNVIYPPYAGRGIDGQEQPAMFAGFFVDPVLSRWPLRHMKYAQTVDAHEFLHQYFQGIVASDERRFGFLDEGIVTYWEYELADEMFGVGTSSGRLGAYPADLRKTANRHLRKQAANIKEPVNTNPSWMYHPGSHGRQLYQRPAASLSTAKNLFGQDVMDRVFQAYYRRFAFKHPTLDDFLAVARDEGGAALGDFLYEAFHRPRMPDYSVDRVWARPLRAPVGRYVRGGRAAHVTVGNQNTSDTDWIKAIRLPQPGAAQVQTYRPGWSDSGGSRKGVIERRTAPVNIDAASGKAHDPHENYVRIGGSGWRHLPVDIVFIFADGAVFKETWSGDAAWQAYHIVYHAKLLRIEIDPNQKIEIDADHANNAYSFSDDPETASTARGWASAAGAGIGLLLMGAAAWF